MTLAVKVEPHSMEKVKKELLAKGLVDLSYRPLKKGGYMYIPVLKKVRGHDAVNVKLEKKKAKGGLKELLAGKLTKTEMKKLQRAFDIVGSIAIIEIPDSLVKKQKLIAEAIMQTNGNIKTVLKKAGIHGEEFRTIPLKWVAGKRTKETVHRENGVYLKLDVEKVYYSPRSSTERRRIIDLVKKGEEVIVMFSGCGPYTCTIGKNCDVKLIVGVEKNPIGHKYEAENLFVNKVTCGKSICGDVRDVVPKLGKFDRVLMPLPRSAEEFLDVALPAVRKGGMVHLYQFIGEEEVKGVKEKVREICKSQKRKCRILRVVKCGQFSPKVFRMCLDIKVE